ncbi:MAG: hypothetical protein COS84_10080 [Armatimonadetes bacterium CG07_land_8_20_14_0_80_40_9]|nr:MAG: hypothetical protein COS84_10080 [Armatimonadetes bacterium CG07_land_8_20_14_0_80_40_9]
MKGKRLIIFLLILLSFFVSQALSSSEGEEYKKCLSRWQKSKKKFPLEIRRRDLTLEEKRRLDELTFGYVKATLTFETVELLKSYLDIQTVNKLLTEGEKEDLWQKFLDDYQLKSNLCFNLEIIDETRAYSYLLLKPFSKNIVLIDDKGKEYKPVKYSKELDEPIYHKVSGKVYFPRIITPQTKWIKINLYNVFSVDRSIPPYHEPEFEFGYILSSTPISKIIYEEDVEEEEKKKRKESPLEGKITAGIIAYKEGNLGQAISFFQEARALDPSNIAVYNLLSITYLKKDLFDAAVSLLKEAIEIDPFSSLSHYNLGLAYRKKKELEKAIVEFKQAVAIDDKYLDAYYYLGLSYEETGFKDEAIRAYKKVLEIDPEEEKAKKRIKGLTQGN